MNIIMTNNTTKPKAFISCSLRPEDKQFIDYIIRVVDHFGFQPFGTVGKYIAEPKPIWQSMKENIANADCVVLAATPRYIQQDIHNKNNNGHSISEMLHVEVGMAIMAEKPILVFVQEGTNIGNFLPAHVQYITLNLQNRLDLNAKWPLIIAYFQSAMGIIKQQWKKDNKPDYMGLFTGILAFIGGVKVLDYLFSDDEEFEDE